MKDYTTHFRELVEQQLPDDSRILVPHNGHDMTILATWRLTTDASRPNKRSRPIRIVISQEALEDHARGSNGIRLASDTRFTAWLQRSLSAFDPDHDAPLGAEPPPVTWNLGTLELNA